MGVTYALLLDTPATVKEIAALVSKYLDTEFAVRILEGEEITSNVVEDVYYCVTEARYVDDRGVRFSRYPLEILVESGQVDAEPPDKALFEYLLDAVGYDMLLVRNSWPVLRERTASAG